jgi:hypothetical protein
LLSQRHIDPQAAADSPAAAAAQIFGWFLVPGALYDLFTGEGEEQGQEGGQAEGQAEGQEEGQEEEHEEERQQEEERGVPDADNEAEQQQQQQQQQGASQRGRAGQQQGGQRQQGQRQSKQPAGVSSKKRKPQREVGAAADGADGAAGGSIGESPVQCKLKQRLLAKLQREQGPASGNE